MSPTKKKVSVSVQLVGAIFALSVFMTSMIWSYSHHQGGMVFTRTVGHTGRTVTPPSFSYPGKGDKTLPQVLEDIGTYLTRRSKSWTNHSIPVTCTELHPAEGRFLEVLSLKLAQYQKRGLISTPAAILDIGAHNGEYMSFIFHGMKDVVVTVDSFEMARVNALNAMDVATYFNLPKYRRDQCVRKNGGTKELSGVCEIPMVGDVPVSQYMMPTNFSVEDQPAAERVSNMAHFIVHNKAVTEADVKFTIYCRTEDCTDEQSTIVAIPAPGLKLYESEVEGVAARRVIANSIEHARSRRNSSDEGPAAEKISLLKIDTEGYDYTILQTLEPDLRDRRIDMLQFEHLWGSAPRPLFEVVQFVGALGYEVYWLSLEGLIRVDGLFFSQAEVDIVSPRCSIFIAASRSCTWCSEVVGELQPEFKPRKEEPVKEEPVKEEPVKKSWGRWWS